MLKKALLFVFFAHSLWSTEFRLDWYSWNGFSDYKKAQKSFFAKLPATNRIFLSFSAQDIVMLQQSEYEKALLQNFFHDAKQHKIKIELLLGEGSYIYPKNQAKLLKLISFFQDFPFTGVQLDIEPSALPKEHYKIWRDEIIKLVHKIKQHTSLPIGLSINHKLTKHILLKELHNAGLHEAVIMYYSINQNKVIKKMQNLLQKNKSLNFSLALSIEPLNILSKDETYAIYGRAKSLQKWKIIDDKLSSNGNFSALVIQSIKVFNEVKE